MLVTEYSMMLYGRIYGAAISYRLILCSKDQRLGSLHTMNFWLADLDDAGCFDNDLELTRTISKRPIEDFFMLETWFCCS